MRIVRLLGRRPSTAPTKLIIRSAALSPEARRSSTSRRGITLLEVLVAMLVLTVGVLGMAAIIPLGKLELADGEISDSASTLGRWAFRDVSVRGFLHTDMWADPLTGRPVIGPLAGAVDRY